MTSPKKQRRTKRRPGGEAIGARTAPEPQAGENAAEARNKAEAARAVANDSIVQCAVRLTGCSFEEILARCRLVPGDPECPEDWEVSGLWRFLATCPNNPRPAPRIKRRESAPKPETIARMQAGCAAPCGQDTTFDFTEDDESSNFAIACEADVRFALLVHWACLANLRGEDNPTLQRVRRILVGFRHERQLGEIHRAEHQRHSKAGKASAQSERRTLNLVEVEEEMKRLQGTPRREQTAIIAAQLGISKSQVRKLRGKIEKKGA